MTRHRKVLLAAVLLSLVGGHLLTLVVDIEEPWPFSNYSLYTEPRDPDKAEQYVLVGVLANAAASELELFLHEEYLKPHYRASHHGTFNRLAHEPDRETALARAAEDCLRLYEDRRRAGHHDGPPLIAVRIYLYTWRYDVVDPVTRRPTDRTLLIEARLPVPGDTR